MDAMRPAILLAIAVLALGIFATDPGAAPGASYRARGSGGLTLRRP